MTARTEWRGPMRSPKQKLFETPGVAGDVLSAYRENWGLYPSHALTSVPGENGFRTATVVTSKRALGLGYGSRVATFDDPLVHSCAAALACPERSRRVLCWFTVFVACLIRPLTSNSKLAAPLPIERSRRVQ